MNIRQSRFKELKGLLDPLRLIYYPYHEDIHKQYSDPIIDTGAGKYLLCAVESIDGVFYPISIEAKLSNVRDEAISNLSMPIDKSEKDAYLNEIIDFYSSIEDKIVEDNKGQLAFDLHIFLKHHSQMELYPEDFHFFLDKLKDNLRNEVKFMHSEHQRLLENDNYEAYNKELILKLNLKWNRSKINLIELFAALVESKSILKDNQPVSLEFMAELLSEIFVNLDLSDFRKDLSQAKKRKKVKTVFLNHLVDTFNSYANRKYNLQAN